MHNRWWLNSSLPSGTEQVISHFFDGKFDRPYRIFVSSSTTLLTFFFDVVGCPLSLVRPLARSSDVWFRSTSIPVLIDDLLSLRPKTSRRRAVRKRTKETLFGRSLRWKLEDQSSLLSITSFRVFHFQFSWESRCFFCVFILFTTLLKTNALSYWKGPIVECIHADWYWLGVATEKKPKIAVKKIIFRRSYWLAMKISHTMDRFFDRTKIDSN